MEAFIGEINEIHKNNTDVDADFVRVTKQEALMFYNASTEKRCRLYFLNHYGEKIIVWFKFDDNKDILNDAGHNISFVCNYCYHNGKLGCYKESEKDSLNPYFASSAYCSSHSYSECYNIILDNGWHFGVYDVDSDNVLMKANYNVVGSTIYINVVPEKDSGQFSLNVLYKCVSDAAKNAGINLGIFYVLDEDNREIEIKHSDYINRHISNISLLQINKYYDNDTGELSNFSYRVSGNSKYIFKTYCYFVSYIKQNNSMTLVKTYDESITSIVVAFVRQ